MAGDLSQERLVHTFEKNTRERIHVALTTFDGRDLISLRAFYRRADGSYAPTPRGLAFDQRLLPELEVSVARLRAAVNESAAGAADIRSSEMDAQPADGAP